MAAYDVSASTPTPQYHKRIEQIMTDMAFGYPVELARRELSAGLAEQDKAVDGSAPFPSETRSFRIKFGNPFPGPCHNVAHHCVDLIYIYDCFYDDLRRKDRKRESAISQEPCPKDWASNSLLVSIVQDLWISFITDEEVKGSEPIAYVFDVDRKLYLKEMETDEDWAERRIRLEVMAKNHDIVKEMADAFVKMVKFE